MNNTRVILYNMLFLTYMLNLVIPQIDLKLFISIVSIFVLVIAFVAIKFFYQLLTVASLLFSMLLMFSNNLFNADVIYYFSGMTNILILIIYASVFSIPVYLGAYPRKIYLFLRNKVNSIKKIYITFSISSFLICSFMTAAAFPTIKTSLSRLLRDLPNDYQQELQVLTLTRPFALTLFWTPIAVAPTIVITETGSNPLTVLSIMFSFSILFLITDMITTPRKLSKKMIWAPHIDMEKQAHKSYGILLKTKISLLLFLMSIILFISVVLVLHQSIGYSILDAVIVTIIPYSFIWSLILKKGKRFGRLFKKKMRDDVPKVSPQIALFISIGFMINIIGDSKLSDQINNFVILLMNNIGPLVLICVSLVAFFISCLGILPQLVAVLMTQTLIIDEIGLKPESFAIAVLVGVISGTASSHFSVNVHFAATTLNEKPSQIVKTNIMFSVCILFIIGMVATILESF